MASQLVRISEADHAALSELSKQLGTSMSGVLSEAIRLMRNRELLRRTNEAYAALRRNPKAWQEEKKERAQWESALRDGME
ncbi:MAG TPA: toxin-antitoxin system protein [Candidatus Hydrogenedentes bacterium]|nr:toxin-antitoxin system protein [Candidatus Hydrogenedentota bacterium]